MGVVLLVLDRDEDRQTCRAILGTGGYAVHEVDVAAEALDRIHQVRPLAVVVAADLPEPGCLALCRALHPDRSTSGLPVLLIAAGDDDPGIPPALEAGADDYVCRGCSAEILLCRLRRLIRDRQLTRSALLNEQLAQIGRLLTGIVHEIRGPLTVIRGQAELLQIVLGNGHDYLRYIEPILRNTQLMQARLDHLMATVRGGPPTLVAVDIKTLVHEAAELFQKGTDPRRERITIELDLPEGLPPVTADAGRMLQVLMSLLTNASEAIQTTRCLGRVRLRCGQARDQDRSWTVIDVDDNGPGLPEDQLDRIFEPFFTTKAAGSGYGLYLASEILREHGGRLTARSSDLGGARFTIWLPLDLPDPLPRP